MPEPGTSIGPALVSSAKNEPMRSKANGLDRVITKLFYKNKFLILYTNQDLLVGENFITNKSVNLIFLAGVQMAHVIKYSRYIFK